MAVGVHPVPGGIRSGLAEWLIAFNAGVDRVQGHGGWNMQNSILRKFLFLLPGRLVVHPVKASMSGSGIVSGQMQSRFGGGLGVDGSRCNLSLQRVWWGMDQSEYQGDSTALTPGFKPCDHRTNAKLRDGGESGLSETGFRGWPRTTGKAQIQLIQYGWSAPVARPGPSGRVNGLHRTLDIQFREDDCRMRVQGTPPR